VQNTTNTLTVNTNGITDTAGNNVSSITGATYTVDTVAPTGQVSLGNSVLAIGGSSSVTITFSEAVTGLTNAGVQTPNATLSTLTTADGGKTWTATLTPTSGVQNTTNTLTVNTNGITDTAGNNVSSITGVSYTVDTVRPAVTIALSDSALNATATSTVTFTFSEKVNAFTNADITAPNGTLSPVSSSDGGTTWTATYTPNAGVVSPTNVITVDTADVTDVVGNPGAGTTESANYTIDSARPTVTVVVAGPRLGFGRKSLVTFTFSEPVTGFTNSDITVANGMLTPVSSTDGGTTWTATLTPKWWIRDRSNVITVDTTGVTDSAGNIGVGTSTSNNYTVDTTLLGWIRQTIADFVRHLLNAENPLVGPPVTRFRRFPAPPDNDLITAGKAPLASNAGEISC
jgi:hypothetical protein